MELAQRVGVGIEMIDQLFNRRSHWRQQNHMVTYGLNDGSRMSREAHVRFSEGPRVKFPRPTQPKMTP